jgi:hypothetical protein
MDTLRNPARLCTSSAPPTAACAHHTQTSESKETWCAAPWFTRLKAVLRRIKLAAIRHTKGLLRGLPLGPARCGNMVHVDVKKLGKILAGDGWRGLGRAVGGRNSNADKSSGVVSRYRNPIRGYHCVHTAIDGHSRLA